MRSAPLSGLGGWPRVSWTSVAETLKLSCFALFLILLVRPGDVPDPFTLGLSLSLTAVCLVTAALVWLPDVLAGRWPSTAIDRVLALYLVIVTVTSINTVNAHATMIAVLQLLGNVGVFYATIVLARKTPRLADGILLLLVASMALLLLMGLAYHAEQGLLTRPKVYPVPEGWSGYPELGTLAVIQFGLLAAALQTVSSAPMFLVTATLVIINLVELVLLYYRGSWLAAGLVVFAASCLMARQLTRLLGTVGVVAVAGTVLFLASPTFRYLTATMVAGSAVPAWAREGVIPEVATPEGRIQIWQRTLRMISDHPVRGVGSGNFQEVFQAKYIPDSTEDLRRAGVHAHNLWLQQFAELGVLGGAISIVLWVRILAICWRSARERPAFLSLGLLLSIVGILGSNLTTNMFFLTGGASGRLQSLTWMLFGLAVAAPPRGD